MNVRLWFLRLGAALFCSPPFATLAAGECEPWVAQVVSVQGQVEARRAGQVDWRAARLDEAFCAGDSLRVEARGRAALLMRSETVLRLDQGTAITFSEIKEQEPSWLELIRGAVYFISRVPRTLRVKTAFVNAAVEGTEFLVRVEENEATLWIFQGQVLASNPLGSLMLKTGETAIARAGEAPMRRLVIRPRDAVQWALYYPPIIDYRTALYAGPSAAAIREALARYRAGDLAGAFAELDRVPVGLGDARYFTLRAGLLLSVGRVDEARPAIERALALDPGNATAVALQSVIAVARNEKEQALGLARQAVELDPHSPVPRVALSYAYQASFNIEQARENVQEAVKLAADNALAWARLSELWLSQGYVDRALEAAQRAVSLDPDLARTQTVLGFAHLTQIRIGEAKAAFEKAIELDPAAPLPRLGLGLALIRRSDLAEGTRELEIAASLDPDNSLIRSYLGKAYYEQKRAGLAGTEFAIAKELDPKDPTPWFYDAILKQTINQPVEALHDLQKSIELNDNRAVYRSRLLLDQDLAARSASLARIYSDLRFQQLALVEGWTSVNTDPTNFSAHRFLADAYATVPRHETARVSELLQSQLLQPINVNPVQPQLAESNLAILRGAGPGESSFNEFNPLFASDGVTFQGSGIAGSNATLGDELALSGLKGKLSYSLGQFHYETDGFRDNNDLGHDIYNLFVQLSPSYRSSVQVELRKRETTNGDIDLRFFPDRFLPDFRRDLDLDTYRFGFRYAPTPSADLIGSVIYQDRLEKVQVSPTVGAVSDAEALSAEVQHLWRAGRVNLIAGAGFIDEDSSLKRTVPSLMVTTDTSVRQWNGYVYSQLRLAGAVTGIIGLGHDSFDSQVLERTQLNPKFGLLWQITPSTTLRAAAFRTLKRTIVANQTIEPTNIAGFNQFFDDGNGTDTKRYGIAIDQTFSSDLFGGVEFSARELDTPFLTTPTQILEQDELSHRAYLYWAPHRTIALGAEYLFDRFSSEPLPPRFRDPSRPDQVRTERIPLTINYYHPKGFFALAQATHVRQQVKFPDQPELSDRFWVVDASVGYRLPKRKGIVSLDVKNLFDEDFNFQDTNFQSSEAPRLPLFQPERTLFFRFTLSL